MHQHHPTCRCPTCRVAVTDPSPAEIERQCEAIRRTWSPAGRTARIVDDETRKCATGGVVAPLVSLDDWQDLVDQVGDTAL